MPSKPSLRYLDTPRQWTLWQRFQIWAASYLGCWLIRLIGRTLRFEVQGEEYPKSVYQSGRRFILVFWHNRIFGSTWYFRHRGIVVMTSQNFDGEYIARFIRMLGYGAARGSSSSGGLKALVKMARDLERGVDVAFTIDGPRGPRYQAKVGPVILARKTGMPIQCFNLSYEKKWVIRGSWDQFQIPKPFSRAFLLYAPPIVVPRNATEEELIQKQGEMQQTLDRIREESDAHWDRQGASSS